MAMNNIPKASGGGFKMKPGSKNLHSEGTFRMDSPMKELGFNSPAEKSWKQVWEDAKEKGRQVRDWAKGEDWRAKARKRAGDKNVKVNKKKVNPFKDVKRNKTG